MSVPPPPPEQPERSQDAAPPPPPPPPGDGGDGSVRRSTDKWSAGRIVALVAGIILALFALALLAGGGFSLWADQTQRDADGFITTGEHRFASPTYAIATNKVDLHNVPTGLLDKIRIDVRSLRPNATTFVGIARVEDVERYLAGVRHATITDFDSSLGRAEYEVVPGGAPSEPPEAQPFWSASGSGSGRVTVTWDVQSGSWAAVVMNGNASLGISVVADVGARVPSLLWIAIGLLIAGVVFAAGSAFLLWFAFHTRRET